MKLKQKQISKIMGTTDAYISMIFLGRRPVSWPMAERLSELFPGKSIKEWKKANPDEVRRAFSLLTEKEVVA